MAEQILQKTINHIKALEETSKNPFRRAAFQEVYCYIVGQIMLEDAIKKKDEPIKHGHIINPTPYGECSICGYLLDIREEWNYCPNCGAKMDKVEENG